MTVARQFTAWNAPSATRPSGTYDSVGHRRRQIEGRARDKDHTVPPGRDAFV